MQRVLLIIGGGIAAYKAPELVRRLRDHGLGVRCLLTSAAAQFVAPLSLASVSGDRVYENLFDLTDEAEMGHIQLSRDADLILVAPATADIMARMAHGTANDLASTTLLATDKPVMIAPAMNVRMWTHGATQRNLHSWSPTVLAFWNRTTATWPAASSAPDECRSPTRLPRVWRLNFPVKYRAMPARFRDARFCDRRADT